MDRELWHIDRYLDFLAARRELLADAANKFLDSLYSGTMPEPAVAEFILQRAEYPARERPMAEDEEKVIFDCVDWIAQQRLPD